MTEISKLRELLERVESATAYDADLFKHVARWLLPDDDAFFQKFVKLVNAGAFVDAAVALCERVLPGWFWKVGTCCVSDDACVAPDYNSPEHGERLKREFPLPTEQYPRPGTHGASPTTWGPYDEGFDIDRRPPGNVALALCEAVLQAKLYIAEQAAA